MSLSQELKELGYKVELECLAQIRKWGEQDHPSFPPVFDKVDVSHRADYYGVPHEDDAKRHCQSAFEVGVPTYGHIFLEEVAEVFGTTNASDLEDELIQVAAVALNWIRAIRRRRNTTQEQTA